LFCSFFAAAPFESLTPGGSAGSDLVREDSPILTSGLRSPLRPIGEEGSAHALMMLQPVFFGVFAANLPQKLFRLGDLLTRGLAGWARTRRQVPADGRRVTFLQPRVREK
jgi:hypothetical protein